MNPRTDKTLPAGTSIGLGATGPLRPFLAFLRQRMTLLLVWPAMPWSLSACCGPMSGATSERREREAELERQVDAYTRSLVIRTRGSIAETDRLLLLLRHNWVSSGYRNTGPDQLPGLVVMRIDGEQPSRYKDARYRSVVVLFNVDKEAKTIAIPELKGLNLRLHKLQRKSDDPVVKTSSYSEGSGSFTIPARTTAVFVERGEGDED